jgi:hypothetical protein
MVIVLIQSARCETLLFRYFDHTKHIKKQQNCDRDRREKEQLEKHRFGTFAELDFDTFSFDRFILHFTPKMPTS